MSEQEQPRSNFLGTYFDRSSILRVARWAEILSWVVAAFHALDLILAIGVFVLEILRGFTSGLGFSDYVTQVLFLLERPFRGIVYFVVLQAAAKALLILLDMEDNTRRAARK